MALGLNTESGSGNFVPWLKWDARSGRWFRKNPEQGGSDIDITNNFAAIVDMANIEVGWLAFTAGGAPSFMMHKLSDGGGLPPRPSEDHRQGFRVRVWLSKECGGGEHEVAGTAKALLQAIDKLHDAYLAGLATNAGKLPVVQMAGAIAIETETPKGRTRNFSPDLKVASWAPWPKKADEAPAAPAPAAIAAAATQAPPPNLNDFG